MFELFFFFFFGLHENVFPRLNKKRRTKNNVVKKSRRNGGI